MKILQVFDFLSPLHGGGCVEVVSQLSKILAQRDHEVVIYTSDFELNQEYINSLPGVKVYTFHSWINSWGFYLTSSMLRRLRKELKSFDVIHLHGRRSFQNIVMHHYAQKYGIPYVLQAHGTGPVTRGRQGLRRLYDIFGGDRVLKDASKVIVGCEIELEQYQGKIKSLIEEKIEPVPFGINLSQFNHLPAKGTFRNKYDLNNNHRLVLYLGRINEIKGLDLMVRAFAGLPAELEDTKLVIVGPDDGYLPTLRKVMNDVGIADRTLVTGSLYGSDKLAAYVDADVYMLTSIYDALPLTMLEACACGTPVVITDNCGAAALINGRVGYAVPRNEGHLRDALAAILTDKKLRQQFGNEGKKLVSETFNLEKMVDHIESIYESVSPSEGLRQ